MELDTLHRSTAPVAPTAFGLTPEPPVKRWKGCEAFRDGLETALAAIGLAHATETTAGYWTAVGYGSAAGEDRMIGRVRFGILGSDDADAHPCAVASQKIALALQGRGLAAHQDDQRISVVAPFAWQGA